MVRLSPRSFSVLEDGARTVESPGDHVGLVLREARLASGRDLSGIAADLRIRYTYLAAIEDGRFDILPGPTYAVGFVRSYAEYLGLRHDLLVDRFKSEASGVSKRQELDFPTPMPEGRFPGGAMMAVAAVFVAAIFGGWYYLDQNGRLTYPRVPQLPSAIASVPPRLAAPFVAAVPPRAAPAAAPAVVPATAVASLPPTAMASPVETGRVITEAPPARDPAASIVVPLTRPEAAAAVDEDEPATAGAEPADTIPPEAAEAEEDDIADVAAAVPASAEPAPAALVAPAREPAATTASVAAASPAIAAPLPVTDPAATAPSALATAPPAAAPVQQAALPEPPQAPGPVGDAGRVLGRVNQDARIVLNATADSWVQVRDGEQNVLFTQMLRAGDRYRVPNRDGLVLLTGNAGGLVVAVDGAPVPMLGPEGAVLRNVRLDAGALKTGTATR